MKAKDFVRLKEEGQVCIGDELVIIGKSKSDSQVCTVEDCFLTGGKEEVIINTDENRYFITEMYLNGESWAEDIFIIWR